MAVEQNQALRPIRRTTITALLTAPQLSTFASFPAVARKDCSAKLTPGVDENASATPHYRFADAAEEQEAQLAINPLIRRFAEFDKAMAGDISRPAYHFVSPEACVSLRSKGASAVLNRLDAWEIKPIWPVAQLQGEGPRP